MDLFSQVSADIVSAMKARDKVSLEALRNIKKVFLEAKTAPGANDTLSDADSAAIYTEQGRADLAEAELAQVAVIERYLPKALTEEELTAALREIIAQVGASSPRDMGKVMGIASKQLAGKAEGSAIAAKVKELLS